MALATQVLDRRRALLEVGLGESLGRRNSLRLLSYMEDSVERRVAVLPGLEALGAVERRLASEIVSTREDMFQVVQKLTERISALENDFSGRLSSLERDFTGKSSSLERDLMARIVSLDQKLSTNVAKLQTLIHANTWKTLSGMAVILGVFRFLDMFLSG